MFYKSWFVILKELQLTWRTTCNGAVPCTLETSGTNSSLLLKKKDPQGKTREKRKQGARLVEALKSRITQIHNFISGKLQSPQRITNLSLHLRKLQSARSFSASQKKKLQSVESFFTSANTQSRQKPQERERKGERENEGEGERENGGIGIKEERTGIMEKAGLKIFPSEAYRPLRIRSLFQFLQWAGLGNNTTPTGGKLGKNTTPTNSRAEEPSAGP